MNLSRLRKTIPYPLLLLLACSSQAMARGDIASCVDEEGVITYTDILCYTVNELPPDSELGLVAKDRAMTRAPSKLDPYPLQKQKPETIVSTQLESAVGMAVSECTERFKTFFRRKHPRATDVSRVNFSRIIDQFEKGDSVSISVSSNLKYTLNDSTYQSSIECTLQNLNGKTDWVVGFIER